MINSEKIEDWIREAEERPASTPLIIRFIANSLAELTAWNEELLNENVVLRSGQRVEEYESRIASLEYQLDLLKRQLKGEAVGVDAFAQTPPLSSSLAALTNLLLYNTQGQFLRVEWNTAEPISGEVIAAFSGGGWDGKSLPAESVPHLLTTSAAEELLFVFDSGRTVTMPVSEIHSTAREDLDWRQAARQELRGNEQLVIASPIARMSLFEYCVQASRKGFVKKVRENTLESYIAKEYIGAGVKQTFDKPCSLTFCNKDDLFVMVTKEGLVWSMEVDQLPVTIEAVLRLDPSDHIVTAFIIHDEQSLLVLTQNGKVLQREKSWLEPASTFKTKGQPLISKERREAGVWVSGAAPVNQEDWGAVLRSDGKLTLHKMADLFASGSVFAGQTEFSVLGLAIR